MWSIVQRIDRSINDIKTQNCYYKIKEKNRIKHYLFYASTLGISVITGDGNSCNECNIVVILLSLSSVTVQ